MTHPNCRGYLRPSFSTGTLSPGDATFPKTGRLRRFSHARGGDVMPETCDHCGPGVRATWRATHGFDLLTLCAHCCARHRVALMAKGWLICLLPSTSAKANA